VHATVRDPGTYVRSSSVRFCCLSCSKPMCPTTARWRPPSRGARASSTRRLRCPTATESMWILRFDDHGCIMCRSLRLLVPKCKHRILHLNYREFFSLHRKRETVAPIVKAPKTSSRLAQRRAFRNSSWSPPLPGCLSEPKLPPRVRSKTKAAGQAKSYAGK
jgi:hypothetical protein